MEISKVSNDDGRMCAFLIEFMQKGRWELTSADADKLSVTKRWLVQLAQQMGAQLKKSAEESASPTAAPIATSSRKKK